MPKALSVNNPLYQTLSKHSLRLITLGWIIFVCGFYFFPTTSRLTTSFYVLLLLPALLILPTLLHSRAYTLRTLAVITVPTLYLAVTHLWSTAERFEPFFFIKQSLFITLFTLATIKLFEIRPKLLLFTIKLVIAFGVANACYSLYQHMENDFHGRLLAINLSSNPNKNSAMHTIISVLCFAFAMESKNLKVKALLLTLAIPSITSVIFSESRGSLMTALAVMAAYFTLDKKHNLQHAVALTGSFFFLFATAFVLCPEVYESLIDRANTRVRVKVWQQSIQAWQDSPFFGSGITRAKYQPVNDILLYPHSHNLLLDTMRVGGVVGLALLVFQIASVTRGVATYYHRSLSVRITSCWFFTGLLLLMVYGRQPLSRPEPNWLMYWVPLVLLFALLTIKRHTDQSTNH